MAYNSSTSKRHQSGVFVWYPTVQLKRSDRVAQWPVFCGLDVDIKTLALEDKKLL